MLQRSRDWTNNTPGRHQDYVQSPSRSSRHKFYFLGLLIGFLPALAFLLLYIKQPTDVLAIFTGINLSELNDRPLKMPLALLTLGLFLRTSIKLYKSGRLTIYEQCGLIFIATLIVAVWFWIALLKLAYAMRGLGW